MGLQKFQTFPETLLVDLDLVPPPVSKDHGNFSDHTNWECRLTRSRKEPMEIRDTGKYRCSFYQKAYSDVASNQSL